MINLNMQGGRSYDSFLFYQYLEEKGKGKFKYKGGYKDAIDDERTNPDEVYSLLQKEFEIIKVIHYSISDLGFYSYLHIQTKEKTEHLYKNFMIFVNLEDTDFYIDTYAESREDVDVAHKIYDRIFEKVRLISEDNHVSINVWYDSPDGANYYNRKIEVPKFGEIEHNYSSKLRRHVKDLFEIEKPWERGKLIFWMGPPGTGKTYCVRSLIEHWKNDFTINLIVDPESFLRNPCYLKEVVLSHSGRSDKANLIILEDCPRSVLKEARAGSDSYNMGRLLNITDGILGQGLKLIFLMTTNDDIKDIDKAFLRDGRCLQRLKFGLLDPESANEWLEKNGYEGDFVTKEDIELARLFAIKNNLFADADEVEEEHVGFFR